MIFAEFQQNSTGWNGRDFSGPVVNIPACGSDGVYILDGRFSRARQIESARKYAEDLVNVRRFTGFIPVRQEEK